MSILLEALKKSEAQRQLGATPTLQTPVEPSRQGTSGWGRWAPVAMGFVAAAVIAWAGWMQFRPPAATVPGGHGPVAGMKDPAAATASAPVPAAGRRDVDGSGKARQRPSSPGAAQRKSTGEDVAEKRRLLGKSYRAYEPPPGAEPATAAAAAQTASATPAPGAPAAAPEEPTADAREVPGRSSAVAAPGEETVSYWQIPASLREGLPELRIRVLVFAERPEDRFLLINEKRLREGEELERGLRLEEIQRDRAIFSYQNYRFHLKG